MNGKPEKATMVVEFLKGECHAGMFVCGAWWFYWECGAVFDRAFSGGDCERISCENVLHQSPGVVYFGDRERIGAAGPWDLAESGAVFADWCLRGLYDVFNVFERGAEACRWWASGGGAFLYGAFCGTGAGLLLWRLVGGADALTKMRTLSGMIRTVCSFS